MNESNLKLKLLIIHRSTISSIEGDSSIYVVYHNHIVNSMYRYVFFLLVAVTLLLLLIVVHQSSYT